MLLGKGGLNSKAEPFLDARALCSTATARAARGPLRAVVLPPQQLRQRGDVGGDPSRFVAGEQLGCRASAGLLLEIDVGKRLPTGVADDEAGVRQGSQRPV